MANAVFRSARLELCATPQQETVLRRAAQVTNKSLTDFILDRSYQAAEQTLTEYSVNRSRC
ncbi:type II toxin-antitoxin system TacA family antitoxin [Pseudomonas laurentiana]